MIVITLVVAYVMARFEFELADKDGNPSSEMPRFPNRSENSVGKIRESMYIRCRARD